MFRRFARSLVQHFGLGRLGGLNEVSDHAHILRLRTYSVLSIKLDACSRTLEPYALDLFIRLHLAFRTTLYIVH